jgi:thioredoxin-dependent peroxiredoxin
LIDPGTPAPDFELPDQDGDPVKLADLKGKTVVLYFYPRADGCGWATGSAP